MGVKLVSDWLTPREDITFDIESIMEVISDVRNADDDLVSISCGNNQTECRCC